MGSRASEWRADICKEPGGEVIVALYEVADDGQLSMIDTEHFGPFDTATDVCRWLVRHWGPRALLLLR